MHHWKMMMNNVEEKNIALNFLPDNLHSLTFQLYEALITSWKQLCSNSRWFLKYEIMHGWISVQCVCV